jgi:hypothetical protein
MYARPVLRPSKTFIRSIRPRIPTYNNMTCICRPRRGAGQIAAPMKNVQPHHPQRACNIIGAHDMAFAYAVEECRRITCLLKDPRYCAATYLVTACAIFLLCNRISSLAVEDVTLNSATAILSHRIAQTALVHTTCPALSAPLCRMGGGEPRECSQYPSPLFAQVSGCARDGVRWRLPPIQRAIPWNRQAKQRTPRQGPRPHSRPARTSLQLPPSRQERKASTKTLATVRPCGTV